MNAKSGAGFGFTLKWSRLCVSVFPPKDYGTLAPETDVQKIFPRLDFERVQKFCVKPLFSFYGLR